MNEEKARKILGKSISDDGGLFSPGHYMGWTPGDEEIVLDSRFTLEELEAIVWWMKNTPSQDTTEA